MGKKIRFFITCFGILLPLVCLCLYARFNMMAYMDGEAPYYLWNKETANKPSDRYYDVVILGDSSANAAYEPAFLSDTTLNLSQGGSSAIENYYTLKEWLSNNPAPKICYITFYSGSGFRNSTFWERAVYFHRYHIDQFAEVFKFAEKYNDTFYCKDNYIEDFVGYSLCLPDHYMTALVNARFSGRANANQAADRSVRLHRGRYIAVGIHEMKPEDKVVYDTYYKKQLSESYYRRLIELCLDNNIQVHIIKSPYHPLEDYANSYMDVYTDYFEKLQEIYPGVTVDWVDRYETECFSDAHHVNTRGALRFCTDLKELYPEDFGSAPLSQNQVEVVNEAIKAEKKLGYILELVEGRDYTLVVTDKSGKFADFYCQKKDEVGLQALDIAVIDRDGLDDQTKIYSVSGQNNAAEEVDLEDKNFQVPSEAALRMVVIDHYNHNILCMKDFKYNNSQFVQ